MYWFGESWGAPACTPEQHVETPVGVLCSHCDEPIEAGECGFTDDVLGADPPCRVTYHHACYMRQIVGSVAHQLRRCSCFVPGSEEDDPIGLTKRQAAIAAVEMGKDRAASVLTKYADALSRRRDEAEAKAIYDKILRGPGATAVEKLPANPSNGSANGASKVVHLQGFDCPTCGRRFRLASTRGDLPSESCPVCDPDRFERRPCYWCGKRAAPGRVVCSDACMSALAIDMANRPTPEQVAWSLAVFFRGGQ